jgi:protein-disulfide isomerase
MRMRVRLGCAVALLCMTGLPTLRAWAQTGTPDAPAPQNAAPAAPESAPPAAPAQPQPMPPPDPANFTASTPTKDAVNDFLKASWGYDPNRIWQVQAIQTTPVQGLSKVTVLVEEKGSQQQQPGQLVFLTLPDGKHLIANDEVLPFGSRPFDANNSALERAATGPSRGPANSPLLLVEFADFECPHCKEAQPTVDRLLKEYPQARYVSQPFPLRNIHSEAEKAAETGVCVAKIGGNDAFFKYSDAVYAAQASLTPQGSTTAIQAAVVAAGVDQARVQSCVSQPSTKAAVDESLKLGTDLGVNSTPTLFVNGRNLPLGGMPYETLKQIIDYDVKMAGAGK